MKIFNNPQFGEIRTAGTAENPLFCLADVCKSLELHSNVVRQRLTDDVCSTYPGVDSIGVGVQTGVKKDGTPAMQTIEMLFVNEDGYNRIGVG